MHWLIVLMLAAAAGDTPDAVYLKYAAAVEARQLDAAKMHLAMARAHEIDGLSEDDALAQLDTISPKSDLAAKKVTIKGSEAVVLVTAKVAENDALGTIKLVKESGAWKVLSERWDIGAELPSDREATKAALTPKQMTDAQKAAYRQIEAKGYPNPSAELFGRAAVYGDLELAKLTLAAGFSPTDKAAEGALLNAARMKHSDVALFLLKNGADPNSQSEIHMTPLMGAADDCEATELVKALLAAGAKTDVKSDGGTTAAELANFSGCTENEKLIRSASESKPSAHRP